MRLQIFPKLFSFQDTPLASITGARLVFPNLIGGLLAHRSPPRSHQTQGCPLTKVSKCHNVLCKDYLFQSDNIHDKMTIWFQRLSFFVESWWFVLSLSAIASDQMYGLRRNGTVYQRFEPFFRQLKPFAECRASSVASKQSSSKRLRN